MSASERSSDDSGSEGFETSDDHGFFLTIEEHFLRLRGAPMMLSPGDWQIARGWRAEGIPERVVLQVVERLFEQRRERGATGRVQGLRYFDDAVRAAWAEILELRGPQGPAPWPEGDASADVGQRLAALAEDLPADLPERERWCERILQLGESSMDTAGVEGALAELDRELLAAARDRLDAAALARERAEVERAVDTLRARLDTAGIAEARERLLDRRMRDRHGLPELSLFARPSG